jgi:negative regulator of flagellin synthesis FlgM
MVDRINNTGISHGRRIDTGRTNTADSSKTATAKETESSTTSGSRMEGSVVERTREEINASDGIDRQKVDAIKTAIRNGEYSINAKAVAEAFINLEMMAGN